LKPVQPERRFGAPDYTTANFVVHTDCRFFDGGYPCVHWRPCLNCPHHDPVTSRVLIVYLGLLGDMLITSPLPARIKREDPGAHVTWLVDEACAPVVRMNPFVDRVLVFDWEAATQLLAESYDLVIGLERRAAAAALVDRIQARRTVGLAHGGRDNGLRALDDASAQQMMMDVWNDHRTRWNAKTWTELFFECAGFDYQGEPYVFEIPEEADRRVREFLGPAGPGPTVCLNLGGSFPQKVWPDRHWTALGARLLERGARIVLVGGPPERPRCEAVRAELLAAGPDAARVLYTPQSIEEFGAVPRYCDAMVTGDSFGFHVALAHELPCVVMFGPSNPAEVVPRHADYVSVVRSGFACSPCAHQMVCGGAGGCMDVIEPGVVLERVERLLTRPRRPSPARPATSPG
jgi:heptosyltransferase-2